MISEGMEILYGKVASVVGLNAPLVFLVMNAFLCFTLFALFGIFGGWVERKLIARVHSRRGPIYTGPFGLLQNIADLLKFLKKEVLFPKGADRILYRIAPILLVVPTFIAIMFVPIGTYTIVRHEYSLLFALALLGIGPVAVLIGSWASNSKYSTLGGLRAAGMTMSYEVLLGVAAASVALATGTFDIVHIVEYQISSGWWLAARQPLAFVLFLIGIIASVERNPFDLVEAESELVSGWKTEYGGVYYSLTLLAEYAKLFVTSLLFVSLFLGGGSDAIFFLKVFIISLLMFYIRATAFRLRLDQVLAKVWHTLIPLGLLNFIITISVQYVVGGL